MNMMADAVRDLTASDQHSLVTKRVLACQLSAGTHTIMGQLAHCCVLRPPEAGIRCPVQMPKLKHR